MLIEVLNIQTRFQSQFMEEKKKKKVRNILTVSNEGCYESARSI